MTAAKTVNGGSRDPMRFAAEWLADDRLMVCPQHGFEVC
jgi:hypothetical protein